MSDPTLGLYGKYHVIRADGSSQPGKKHHGCQYFVLDLDHDRHARAAIAAYRESCKNEFPALANDLHALLYACEFGGTPTAELGSGQETGAIERGVEYYRKHGHGHVVERDDGVKARCGGPAVCKHCQLEKTATNRRTAHGQV